jgi:hypothetical protein
LGTILVTKSEKTTRSKIDLICRLSVNAIRRTAHIIGFLKICGALLRQLKTELHQTAQPVIQIRDHLAVPTWLTERTKSLLFDIHFFDAFNTFFYTHFAALLRLH